MGSPEALAAAYRRALPLMAEIAPNLDVLPAHANCIVMVAKHAAPTPRDLGNVIELSQGVLRCIEVLIEVATAYHAAVGDLVAGEDVPGSEVQLE